MSRVCDQLLRGGRGRVGLPATVSALILLVLLAVGAEGAQAAGELQQKAGTEGCIENSGAEGCADGRGMDGGHAFVVSPDGKNAYASYFGSGAIVVFDRNTSTGSLTQKAGAAGCVSHSGADGCATGRGIRHMRSIALSPDGSSLYATSYGAIQQGIPGAVAIFDRDTTTGVLTQKAGPAGCIANAALGDCAVGRALDGASDALVSANGQQVYVAAAESDAIAIFQRAGSGALTQNAGSGGCVKDGGGLSCDGVVGMQGPVDLEHDQGSARIYAAARDSESVAVFNRDFLTGRLFQKAGSEGCIADDPTGTVCADGHGLAMVNQLEVSPDDSNLYAAAPGMGIVSVFDRASEGALTQKPGPAGCFGDLAGCTAGPGLYGAKSVAASPDGAHLYVGSGTSDAIAVFDRGADGALIQKAGGDGCVSRTASEGCALGRALNATAGVAVSGDGANVYAATGNSAGAVAIFNRLLGDGGGGEEPHSCKLGDEVKGKGTIGSTTDRKGQPRRKGPMKFTIKAKCVAEAPSGGGDPGGGDPGGGGDTGGGDPGGGGGTLRAARTSGYGEVDGKLKFKDKADNVKLSADDIEVDSLTVEGDAAVITGTGILKGDGPSRIVEWTAEVEDNSRKGRRDVFRLTYEDVTEEGDPITSGKIDVTAGA